MAMPPLSRELNGTRRKVVTWGFGGRVLLLMCGFLPGCTDILSQQGGAVSTELRDNRLAVQDAMRQTQQVQLELKNLQNQFQVQQIKIQNLQDQSLNMQGNNPNVQVQLQNLQNQIQTLQIQENQHDFKLSKICFEKQPAGVQLLICSEGGSQNP